MKKILVLLLLVLVPLSSLATGDEKELGFWVEAQSIKRNSPRQLGWFQRDVAGSIGFFAFAEREGRYSQYYLGPTWRPTDWLQLGAGLGRESESGHYDAIRRGYWFDVNLEGFNAFGSFESGFSGRWHKLTATYAFTERFGAGLEKEKYLGFGPRVEWNFVPSKFQLWGAVLREHGGVTTPMLGVNTRF